LVDLTEVQRTFSRSSTDSTEHESVRTIVDVRHVRLTDGRDGLVRTSAGHYSGGDFTDTLVLGADDLSPIWERLRYPQQRYAKEIEYAGASLHQVDHLNDSTHAFDKRFADRVFAFSELDLLVRALPYTSGFRTVVPLYSEGDDSLEMDTLSVIGRTEKGWSVRFADPVIVATYAVDLPSRRIVSYTVVNRKTSGLARRVDTDTVINVQQASDRQAVNPPGLSPLVPAYSVAVRAGDVVSVSGMTGIKPGTQDIVDGGVAAQTRQAMENIRTALQAVGSSMNRVSECTVFLTDMGDYAAMNAVYATFFPENPPARATVAVIALPRPSARVEVKCSAQVSRPGSNR
jgi:2-iminobutanoate/2-iminopropanoate deaminase